MICLKIYENTIFSDKMKLQHHVVNNLFDL